MKKKLVVLMALFMCILKGSAVSYPQVVLRGDYPDPSILRDGKDYYMTHSPFGYTPGFLIWHSQDLLHWEPVCRVTNRSIGHAMAPELTKYKGQYYIYYPAGRKIYVVKAPNISGPWSQPVEVKGANGIDPGHIATPDGKRYLFVNKGRMAPLNEEGTALTDTLRTVHKGWPIPKHWITEGGWPLMHLESPKLVRHGDYYYLISAEGGTAGPATSHMAVVARSHSLEGPWEESPYNPIIHTYSATDQWWSKGHATLIDDVNGNWWMVYHAYANGYHSLGRQTLIEPVAWTADGWLKPVAKQPLPKAETPIEPLSLSDDFQSPTLGLQWVMYREYEPKAITVGGGVLRLRGKGTTPATARYLLTTAEDKGYDVTADVTVGGKAAFAGLMLYYNDKHFSGISTNGKVYEVYHQGQLLKTVRNSFGKRSVIRLRNLGQKLTAQVSRDGKEWQTLVENIDLSQMNHNQLRGFLALRPALMAAGDSESLFRNFTYTAHNTDEKHMAAYLMVYHKDEDHGLHMAISHDGYSFTALNGDKPVISGDTISEQHGIRDPHIYRGPDGAFYMSMTDLHVYGKRDGKRETDWERDVKTYGWGNNRGLVLMKSWDLLNWSRANIDFSKDFTAWNEIGCAWAPETIYDEEAGRMMIYLTMRHKNQPDKLYYVYVNEDYNKVETEPMVLFQYPDETKSAIDGDICKVGDKYYLHYVSHDGTSGIRHAVSDRPTGGWLTDGQWVDASPAGCEAPQVFKRIGEDKYVLMYDIYRIKPMNFGFVETSDFDHYTDLGQFNKGVMKTTNFASPKHGAVVQITAEEAATLERYWAARQTTGKGKKK